MKDLALILAAFFSIVILMAVASPLHHSLGDGFAIQTVYTLMTTAIAGLAIWLGIVADERLFPEFA